MPNFGLKANGWRLEGVFCREDEEKFEGASLLNVSVS